MTSTTLRSERRPSVSRPSFGRRSSHWTIRMLIVVAVLAGYVVASGSSPEAHGQTGVPTRYVPVDPFRLVDTRADLGVARRVDAHTWRVQAGGTEGIPDGAEAVAVTIVATRASAPGYLLTYQAGGRLPTASNLNYEPGHTYSTSAIVPLSSGGAFDIHFHTPVEIVVDVTGAFVDASWARAGRFTPMTPRRLIDTRDSRPMRAGQTITIDLPRSVPADATAAMVTLTSTAPNVPGFFTAYPSGSLPGTSTLNVSTPNSARATTAIIPLSDRSMRIYSSHGGNLLVDLIGYFTGPSASSSQDGLYVPIAPVRRLDTRTSLPLALGETRRLNVSGGGVAVGSLTMIRPSSVGFAALFANGTRNPGTSAINLTDAAVIANFATSARSDAGVAIYSSTTAHYLFDQFGYFTTDPAPMVTEPAPIAPSPPPAPTPPPGGGGGCSVSNLLVPSCGAWLGASVPDSTGGFDFMRGIAEYEAVSGNEPDIVHVYKTGGNPFPSRGDREVSERPGHQRAILLINWKPAAGTTWRQIANGAADGNIEAVAAGIKAYPYKFFLTVWHEPENELGAAGSGKTPEDYVSMYRYVVTRLRALGVTNAVYVWNMMGSSNHASLYPQLYPGDDVVDWIGYDPYGQENESNMAELINRPAPRQDWPGFYEWATAKAPGKPIMLCEWGFNQDVNRFGGSVFDNGPEIVRTQFPKIKAFVYFNSDREFNPRLVPGTSYASAYGPFARSSYFNSTPTSAAP